MSMNKTQLKEPHLTVVSPEPNPLHPSKPNYLKFPAKPEAGGASREKVFLFGVYEDKCGHGELLDNSPGVYQHIWAWKVVGLGHDWVAHDSWLCAPLFVDAISSNENDGDFGILLRFKNQNGNYKTWAMPSELLAGNAEGLIAQLLASGLKMNRPKQKLIPDYISQQSPRDRVTASTSVGWSNDNQSFILPSETLGKQGVVYQNNEIDLNNGIGQKGTLEQWRDNVGKYCQGNPVAQVSTCVSLAGALIKLLGAESGGIHHFGDSSTGKTISTKPGTSIWGSPSFAQSWNATANGLEGKAASVCDTLLMLDELHQSAPRQAYNILYSIANGVGKTRASRTGAPRKPYVWRVCVISTGEYTTKTHLEKDGLRLTAGQENRIMNVPVRGYRYGAFNDLRGFDKPEQLADHLADACGKYYGTAGSAFVEGLMADDQDFKESYRQMKSKEWGAGNSLESRCADRFAMFALAGELAIKYGVLPWAEQSPTNACMEMFKLWQSDRESKNTESGQILNAVNDFIETHGSSRFSPINSNGDEVVHNRAGYTRTFNTDDMIYMFTCAGLKDATKGFDFNRSLRALDDAGWIVDQDASGGQKSKTTKIHGKTSRVYNIIPRGFV